MPSAKHVSVNCSSLDLVLPELEDLRAGSKMHTADASPGLGVAGDVVLVGEFSGGADGHGHEDDDKTKKGGRGQGPSPSQ